MQTIKYGSKGSDVKTLQGLLNTSTQISVSLIVDGDFGKKTRAAVKLYQTANRLESDGIVGAMTWAKLLGTSTPASGKERPVDYKQYDSRWGKKLYTSTGNKSQTMASSACGPTANADVVATFFDSTVTPYDLAQIAVKKGYRTVNSGTAWGFFEYMATQYQFSAFKQTANHTTMTNALADGALVVASMGPGYWTSGGHFICLWKYDGTYIHACDPASSTRKKQKFSSFKGQRKAYFIFYPPVGWNEKSDEEESVSPPIETPVAPAPPTIPSAQSSFGFKTARNGDKGNHVVFVQNKLSAVGYSVGIVDAVFGAKTEAAIRAFQKDCGLAQTGVYDNAEDAAMTTLLTEKGLSGEYFGPTGIYDASKWQGSVNWKKVYESGKVGLMIVRAGYGQATKDTRFEEYMAGLKQYAIPYAAYWFSYATSEAGAETEANSFYKIASPHSPLFYVMDAEDRRVDGSFINAFANKIKALSGKKTGLYVANHLFSEYSKEGMDTALWDFIWIPKYTDSPPTHKPCDIWQYGGAKVSGFSGSIDSNKIPSSGRFDLKWFLGLK